jgi:hypothetical protein
MIIKRIENALYGYIGSVFNTHWNSHERLRSLTHHINDLFGKESTRVIDIKTKTVTINNTIVISAKPRKKAKR